MGGGRRGGGEDVVVGAGGSGDDSASEPMAASLGSSGVSSGSLCSSSLTDDDAESSLAAGDPTPSSRSSPSDTMQLDGDGGGPLYELSPLLAHLPVRAGLSKYYKGKSQSFTSLSDVKCLQDLAKKAAPHTGRKAASRSTMLQHVPGPCGKTIAKKKTPPRGSSRARSRGLSHRSGKPPAYQSKEELCSRDFC